MYYIAYFTWESNTPWPTKKKKKRCNNRNNQACVKCIYSRTSDISIPNKEKCRYLDVFKPNLSLYRLAMTRKLIVIYLRLFWINFYYKRFIVYRLRSNLMDSMTHQLLHMVWETTSNTQCHCGRMTKITETGPDITTFGHMEHHIIIECIFNGIVRDVRASYFSGTTVYEYQSLVTNIDHLKSCRPRIEPKSARIIRLWQSDLCKKWNWEHKHIILTFVELLFSWQNTQTSMQSFFM